jgi:16S rRNA (uracil1498-N3)-methyltransferase
MRRYWVPLEAIREKQVHLEREVFHHVCHVCRLGKKDRFEVLVEGGTAYLVELVEVTKKEAIAEILETRCIPNIKRPFIHLLLAMPHFQTMDEILEKMVELGVKSVTPVFSDFSFVRNYDVALFGKKISRWEKIIVGASQQCGRGELMTLHKPCKLADVLAEWPRPRAFGLFAYEGPGVSAIKPFLESRQAGVFEDIYLFVGSEGGFSHDEVKQFCQIGLEPVTLGDQVLRVETACMTLISALKYEFVGR